MSSPDRWRDIEARNQEGLRRAEAEVARLERNDTRKRKYVKVTGYLMLGVLAGMAAMGAGGLVALLGAPGYGVAVVIVGVSVAGTCCLGVLGGIVLETMGQE